MRVRFWGTRGSLPVAPRGEDVRQKSNRPCCKRTAGNSTVKRLSSGSSMRSWILPSGIVMAATLPAWKSLTVKTTRYAIWVPACAV